MTDLREPNSHLQQPPNEREKPRFIQRNGAVNTSLFASIPYDDLIRQMCEPAFPYLLGFALSNAPGRIKVEHIPPDMVVALVDRIGNEVARASQQTDERKKSETLVYSRSALSFLLVSFVRNDETMFPTDAIKKIKAFYKSDNPKLQDLERDNIGKLIVLDVRNARVDQRLGIADRVAEEILHEFSNQDAAQLERRIQAYTLATGKEATKALMLRFLETRHTIPEHFLPVFANALGFPHMLKDIGDLVKAHPQLTSKIEDLYRKTGISDKGKIFFDIADFYSAVDLSQYGPYEELLSSDLAFLTEQLHGKKKVIDAGCGEGRHLLPLLQNGIQVEGVDVSEEELRKLKEKHPQAVVHKGSIDDLPFADASVDAVYAMGRTLTHMQIIPQGIRMLKEFHRVVSPDGVVLFDLPEITSTEYSGYIAQRRETLQKLGIWNTEEGAIYDSPNASAFIDRLTPTEEQVKAMAALAGFTAEVVNKVPYKGASGKPATNTYWKLVPREEKDLSYREMMGILKHINPTDAREFGIDVLHSGVPDLRGKLLNKEDY